MSATTRRAPTQHALSPVKDLAAAAALGRSRKRSDAIVRGLSLAATAIGLLFLASILATLFVKGFGALNLSVFTEITRPPGSAAAASGPMPWSAACRWPPRASAWSSSPRSWRRSSSRASAR